jgi:Ceramidase
MQAGGRSSALDGAPPARSGAWWRYALLLAIVAGSLAALLTLPRIGQDPAYHGLADRRVVLGIPNFGDVASNLAFLLVGVAGLRLCLTRRSFGARASWIVFFAGVALVCAGSAYYHWTPRDATLAWDRLPMTIASMGLLVALLCEHVGGRFEQRLLAAAVPLGLASVLYWYVFDDLRPYVWIQLAPLLAIPLVVLLFKSAYGGRWLLLAALACYALAKIAEAYDHPIFASTGGWISGHTLKHLLAALACYAIYVMLARRLSTLPR